MDHSKRLDSAIRNLRAYQLSLGPHRNSVCDTDRAKWDNVQDDIAYLEYLRRTVANVNSKQQQALSETPCVVTHDPHGEKADQQLRGQTAHVYHVDELGFIPNNQD